MADDVQYISAKSLALRRHHRRTTAIHQIGLNWLFSGHLNIAQVYSYCNTYLCVWIHCSFRQNTALIKSWYLFKYSNTPDSPNLFTTFEIGGCEYRIFSRELISRRKEKSGGVPKTFWIFVMWLIILSSCDYFFTPTKWFRKNSYLQFFWFLVFILLFHRQHLK